VWHQSVTSSLVLFMLASLEKYARDKRSSLFSPKVTKQKSKTLTATGLEPETLNMTLEHWKLTFLPQEIGPGLDF
jgi:hypothetical protein